MFLNYASQTSQSLYPLYIQTHYRRQFHFWREQTPRNEKRLWSDVSQVTKTKENKKNETILFFVVLNAKYKN